MSSKILNRLSLFIAGFLFQSYANAQLFVSPNTNVFVNNEVVFVKQEVELNAASSNFYLRKDAQLLQGTAAAGANKGLGNLSVFQEGSTNNFQFNYWCSPVGGNLASAGNAPFGITQLRDIVDLTNSATSTPLAMNNYNGTASPFAIAPYWINKLVATGGYADWVQVGSSSNLNAGEGFTMKGTSGTNLITVNGVQNNPGSAQRYDFRGKPNDGTISIPVGIEQFTLTGNPYPSAIDLSAFLVGATNSTGIAYFWEQDKTVNSHYIADYKGGYGAFSPGAPGSNGLYVPATFYSYDGSGNEGTATGTGGTYERRFCPIGQGFLIDGNAIGTVEMKNSYRVFVKEGATNYSQFEKNSNQYKTKNTSGYMSPIQSVSGYDYSKVSIAPTPQIRFNTLLNNEGVRQLALAFIPEATDGVDRAMDAMSSSDDSAADVYFVLEDSEFVINALKFDIDKSIPIGFRNTGEANYKITVKEILNFTGASNVYIHDKVKDLFYDIKNSFHELTLPSGVNNKQYEITFKNKASLGLEEKAIQNFVVYQNNTEKSLTISNSLLMDLATCSLYDVAGKIIFSKKDLGTDASYKFPTSGLSDGIYIVKLATKDKIEVGKKIIIKN
ncbi:T9SS type A sorting domain-containing protein [Flavobacterium xinjiangense]|uniref:Por secretion system C-terminal sorting domain-containing protein n=1 Tax=Flavobacterium xinjiangense TaxID=178356 RepID=A0A1M7DEM5_9FLAO|nr:T9SS type A sorting domain-containing protein [Flavobacterium xinjiangense]SHL77833.1 Por secretion system C-terminal sorting domain-containing protein [Flavobacterium xinjiangense]